MSQKCEKFSVGDYNNLLNNRAVSFPPFQRSFTARKEKSHKVSQVLK